MAISIEKCFSTYPAMRKFRIEEIIVNVPGLTAILIDCQDRNILRQSYASVNLLTHYRTSCKYMRLLGL